MGYKGFSPGLICLGKRYTENTVFEEGEAKICRSGMHFCENPIDVLDHYAVVNDDGTFNDFAEVESLAGTETCDNKKFCTKKLKIGVKLNFSEFISACVDFVLKRTKLGTTSANHAHVVSYGDSAQIGNSGYCAKVASAGDYVQIGSSGASAKIGNTGDYVQIGSAGFEAQIGSSGYSAKIVSSGDYAQVASAGDYVQLGSAGSFAKIGSSGIGVQIGSSGAEAQIGSSGRSAKVVSSGDSAKIASAGDYDRVGSSGEDCVICCAGPHSVAKAKKGSWIALAEWRYDESKGRCVPICVKTERVDGEIIKEDVFYKLVDGKFTEAQD